MYVSDTTVCNTHSAMHVYPYMMGTAQYSFTVVIQIMIVNNHACHEANKSVKTFSAETLWINTAWFGCIFRSKHD